VIGPQLPRLAFWSAAVFAFVMATLPRPPQLPGAPSDKVQHISAFLVLASLAAWAYPRTPLLKILAGLCLLGAAIEIVQLVPGLGRDDDWIDWFADTIAAGLVLGLVGWFRRCRTRPRVVALQVGSRLVLPPASISLWKSSRGAAQNLSSRDENDFDPCAASRVYMDKTLRFRSFCQAT
jgi:hypothetical protein